MRAGKKSYNHAPQAHRDTQKPWIMDGYKDRIP